MVVTRVRTLPQLVAFAILWLMKSAIAKKNLRLLGLQPMGGKIWIGGNACVASCTMALNDINSRSDILPDYNLTYDYVDSQVFLISYFCDCRKGFINETLLTLIYTCVSLILKMSTKFAKVCLLYRKDHVTNYH